MNELFPQENLEKFDEQALDALLNDIDKYDADHNIGTGLGQGLAGMLMQGIVTEDDIEMGTVSQELQKKIEQNLTIQDLEKRHHSILRQLGLSLESPNEKGDFDKNETYAIGSIKINLEDSRKYISFLKSLDKEKITDTQKKLLKITAKKLIHQIENEYNLEKTDDRLLELFLGMREIVSEYERLEMSEKVIDLRNYIDYVNSGYLKEYIFAKKNGIFSPIGEGFTFSTFQNDATYSYYIEYWNRRFFSTLDFIKQNPEAKEFYNKVLKYGLDCINFAEKDLESKIQQKNNEPNKNDEGLQRAINEVKERLLQIPKN